MKERLKELRKALGLTQQEFANRIGINRGNIATYESREGSPGSSVINLICREFHVNEDWLRTGNGPMFIEQSDAEEIDSFIKDILQGEPDFRRRVVSVLSRMTQDEWKMMEKKAYELLEELNIELPAKKADKIEKTSPAPSESAEEVYENSFDSAQKEESTA